jgi:rhodanese-related sulfurtransferase
MRALVLLLVTLLLAGCSAPPGAPGSATPTVSAIARISPAQAAAVVEGKRGVIVDVRSPEEFNQRRVAGAISAPLDALRADPHLPALAAIPADQEILLYCT